MATDTPTTTAAAAETRSSLVCVVDDLIPHQQLIEQLSRCVVGVINPMCAIVGGIVGESVFCLHVFVFVYLCFCVCSCVCVRQ